MPAQSLHHVLKPCSDPLIPINNQNSEENRANFRGINSPNFVDMCTETLGCETGAMCYADELEISSAKKQRRKKRKTKKKDKCEFPPPLTTLRGEARMRLRRKREGGRLLLTPFKPSVLESERRDGRLVLRLLPGRGGGWEEKEEKDGVGGGGKCRVSGRCNQGDFFNYDSVWVASS